MRLHLRPRVAVSNYQSNRMRKVARVPLWPGEVSALLSACATPREKLVVLALLETGKTAPELVSLTRRAINWRDSTIRRKGKSAPVKLSDELRELLQQHFKSTGAFGIGIRQIQRIVRVVGRRAGLAAVATPDVLHCTYLWNPFASADAQDAPRRVLLEAADAADDIILVANDERKYVDMNQAAEKAFGLPRAEIIGQPIDAFFSDAHSEPVPEAWSHFVADGEQFGTCRLRNRPELEFEYRARANFVPGLHVSVLRPLVRR